MAGQSRQKRDEALALALARGNSVAAAARQSTYSERTVQRRLADPAFVRRVQELRDDIVSRSTSYLSAASLEAVKELRKLAKEAIHESVRLRACVSILDLSCKLRDQLELTERLAEIEAKLRMDDATASSASG